MSKQIKSPRQSHFVYSVWWQKRFPQKFPPFVKAFHIILPREAFSRRCLDSIGVLVTTAVKSGRRAPASKYLTLTDETVG